MKFRKGTHDATGLRVGIVVSKFNKFVTSRLLTAAVETLKKAGAMDEALEVVRVPGAFEIPLAARALARTGRFDAVVCLGAVIRGETPHFDYISAEASRADRLGVRSSGRVRGVDDQYGRASHRARRSCQA